MSLTYHLFLLLLLQIGYCIGLMGLGQFILTLLDKTRQWGLGVSAAIGLSFVISVGGLLNLFQLVSRELCIILLLLGVIIFIFTTKNNFTPLKFISFKTSPWIFWSFTLVILLTLFKVLSGAILPVNLNDDFQAYLVFPIKILTTGGLGADPFSVRRLEGGLGASSFLLSTVLAFTRPLNLNILEHGISLLVLLFLIGRNRSQLSGLWQSLFLLGALILSFMIPYVNLTSILSGSVLLYALFQLMENLNEKQANSRVRVVTFALICSSLAALKSNFIPVTGLSILIYYGYKIWQKQYSWQEFISLSLLSVLLLLPWMIDMYHSSGTLLFPILGKGYDGFTYGTFLPPNYGMSVQDCMSKMFLIVKSRFFDINIILLLSYCVLTIYLKKSFKPVVLCISLACIISSLLIYGWVIPGNDRYIFSWVFADSLLLIQEILLLLKNKPIIAFKEASVLFAIAGIILIISFPLTWKNMLNSIDIFKQPYQNASLDKPDQSPESLFIRKDFFTPETEKKYQKMIEHMQHEIPPHQSILAHLSYPFLMDFKRNTVFVLDMPGGSSPPPGLPLSNTNALVEYLRSQSIRYIAYSYADEENFPYEVFKYRISFRDPWIRSSAISTFKFHNLLSQLAKGNRIIYQDQYCYVLDIGR